MAAHFGDFINIVYRTDKWHSIDSRRLVYIGNESLDDCVSQIYNHRDCTTEQAGQLIAHRQSNCTGEEYEWEIELHEIGTFVD